MAFASIGSVFCPTLLTRTGVPPPPAPLPRPRPVGCAPVVAAVFDRDCQTYAAAPAAITTNSNIQTHPRLLAWRNTVLWRACRRLLLVCGQKFRSSHFQPLFCADEAIKGLTSLNLRRTNSTSEYSFYMICGIRGDITASNTGVRNPIPCRNIFDKAAYTLRLKLVTLD